MKRWVVLGLAFCLPCAMAQMAPSAGQLPRLALLDQQRFLQLLVQRSLEVQYSQLSTEVTNHLMKSEAGLYEPTLFLGLREEGRNRQRTADEQTQNPFTQSTSILDETGHTNELGVRYKLPWGSELGLSYKVVKKTNNLIPQYNSGKYDTEYNTLLSLTLKQPLLRNAGRNATETDLRVAELEHRISQQQFHQQLHKTAIDGLNLYWQLYRAEATLALRQNAYTSTEALLTDTKSRIEAGKLPASAALEVQGALLNRQAEVTRSRQALREAQGKLATALNVTSGAGTTPSTQPALQTLDATWGPAPAVPEAALDLWPPYQIAQFKSEQAQVRLSFAQNQLKPLADLVVGYSGTGYDNRAQSARSTAEQTKFPDWYIGVNFELPLRGNQKAQQQFLAQSTRLTQADLELAAIKNSFANDMAVRHSDLKQSRDVLLTSQNEVSLRQAILDNERQRHQLGVGLLGSLIQKQVDLTEAQQRLLENQIRFEVAVATWHYVQGNLLNEHRIQIATLPSTLQ